MWSTLRDVVLLQACVLLNLVLFVALLEQYRGQLGAHNIVGV